MGLGSPRAFTLNSISILLAISVAPTCVAQQARVLAPHKPIPPRVTNPIKGLTPPMKRTMVGGLWMTDANLKSSIYLRNGVETDPITVTPILHLSNGSKYALPDVKVEPAGIAIIDINDGLAKLGISSVATLSGYVELQYLWAWDPFCATIRNVDTAHSLIFTYGLRPSALAPILLQTQPPIRTTPAKTIDGLWWKQESNVAGFVSVANLSPRPAETTIQVTDDQGKAVAQHNFTVSPHGMKLVPLAELHDFGSSQGGIRVTSSEPLDQLIVNGGLEDRAAGYSAIVPFSSEFVTPSTQKQISIAELGLMTGAADPMMSFPAGTTFTPYSVLRNISDTPVLLSPRLWWMEAGAPRSAQLPKINLAPGQSDSLDIVSLLSSFGPKNFNGSFTLVFDGEMNSGALLMSSGSVDQTNSYVFEVVPRAVNESGSKSLQYWSTGNGDDTMVTIWNPADEAQDFTYTLFFVGGHYALPLHLEPRTMRGFNVSEIIQTQVPDADGNIIPASVHEGGAKISGSHAENENILVAIDSGTYNVRKATCANQCQECDGYSSASLIDSPFGLPIGSTHQQNFTLTWNSGTQYDFNSNGRWSSSNTSVATVATGLVRAVSPGAPKIMVEVDGVPVQAGYICTGNFGCPTSNFVQSSQGSVIPVISSISPDWGKIGTSVSVTISGNGFGTAATVAFNGTGISAVVQQPTTNNSISATFTIASSAPIGIQGVSVTNTTLSVTSDPFDFEVSPTGTCAVPVNFRRTSWVGLSDGTLSINYAWDSSTGNASDLSNCTNAEFVSYPGTSATYTWPRPPFGQTSPNPTSISNTGSSTFANDKHSPPGSWIKPYIGATFQASQRYQYVCPCANGGNQVPIANYTITRTVTKNADGTYRYTITKSSGESTSLSSLP